MNVPLQNALNSEFIAILREKPWLNAQPRSLWLATGVIVEERYSFADCLIRVLDEVMAEDGQPMFGFVDTDHDVLIAPSMISRAQEVFLVFAADPLTAYFDRDQVLIDDALGGPA
ncbi:hypothetical protein ACIGKR_12310 [Rhodococcus qingshengii]|uniref:hypothetical protein n=1 Tax=Rhodococcus qingshengii TaxID=334542 RepID=UPI0037C8F9D5